MPLPRLLHRLAGLFTHRKRDHDMDQEMRFHVESLEREHLQAGMTPSDAAREARRRFGSAIRHKDDGHDVRSLRPVEDLLRDIRYATRGLRRNPGFTIAVVLTLALGIGGNTAIFSVVDQLLLRPLPYRDGERLLMVHEMGLKYGTMSVSPANWLDWQRDSRTLESVAVWNTASVTMTGAGEPVRLNGQMVSSEFFPLLGVQPLLGRTINETDDRPNVPRTAVLSYHLWRQRFAGDPTVIGRSIQVNDQPVEIIGVMPDSFQFVYPDNDIWSAYRLDRTAPWREQSGRFVRAVARVKPDSSVAAARTEMASISQRLAATYPLFNKDTTATLVPLREEMTGQVHTALIFLYAAVGVLLSIACFNVANLLLARSASRHREIAIRTALGAGRLAIVRQLMVESLLLATVGGTLGIALARWSLDALVAFAPPDLLRVTVLSVDRPVLMYATALSVLTGLVVGFVPALVVTRRTMASAMQAGARVTQSPRIRQVLIVGQVAMAVVLLCGAGLLIRTVVALNGAYGGFDKQGVLTMDVVLPITRYNPEHAAAFFREAVDALRALPGAESVAAGNSLPMIGSPRAGTTFFRRGEAGAPTDTSAEFLRAYGTGHPAVTIRVVTPGYFHTLRIPVLRGREFTDADASNPAAGFVVNEAFAKAFLPAADPLTEAIAVFMFQKNPYLPVIGVVGDVSEGSVRDNPQPTVFYNHSQSPETAMTLFMRARQPDTIAKSAAAIRTIDPNLAVTKVRTFETALADSLARERLSALVSGALALSGLVLVSLGLYALLAFLVGERTKEIGIRIALGAQRGQVTRSVVGGGLRMVAIGATLGIGGSLLLLRAFGTLLFRVTPYDPATYGAVIALLCVVATIASYVPARRASRVDPLVALRQE